MFYGFSNSYGQLMVAYASVLKLIKKRKTASLRRVCFVLSIILFLLKIVSKRNFHMDGRRQSCVVSLLQYLFRIWKTGPAMNDETHMAAAKSKIPRAL